jgi:drug/metabolite transporter (DMT)-like permease
MNDHQANLRAAGLTAAAVSLFAVSDAVVKLLTVHYPPGQILFCRGVVAVLLLMAAAHLRRRPDLLRLPWGDRASWLRAALELGAALCFFQGLQTLPLAEATAVLFVFPVLLTVLAALVLKERVGPKRWTAVALGLTGALVILRPGSAAFDPATLWPLAAAACVAGRDLVTRFVRPAVPTEAVALLTLGFGTVASLATAPFGWAIPDGWSLLGFVASAALVSVAFSCLVAGTRVGDMSFTAPFRYVTVPLAFVIGFLVWGDVPDPPVFLGTAIVVAAGLLMLRPERPRLVTEERRRVEASALRVGPEEPIG